MGTAEALGGFFEEQRSYAFRILERIRIPNPQYAPTFSFEKQCPPIIIGLLVEMLAAIEFDRQPCFAAGEIDNIRPDDQLPSEGRPIIGKNPPNRSLSRRCLIPQPTSAICHLFRNTAHRQHVERRASPANPPLSPPWKGGENQPNG